MSKSYQFLEPYTFANGVKVKNRVVLPPMTIESSLQDGSVSQDELAYYQQRAGGVGMFISPVANVSDDGKGFEGEPSVAHDSFIPGLSKMAQSMKLGGTKAILQIFHAGRMSNSSVLRGVQPVSASAVAPVRPGAEVPRALTEDEIEAIIEDFGQATRRAILAGFDGVELHGANTYLMQQFFSPHSNRRDDQWGGSVEKRMHFALAIIKRVHEIVEEYADERFLVGYRISPEEIEKPGISIDDTLKFVDVLGDQPISYLHLSMGSAWRASLNDPSVTTPTILRLKEVLKGRKPLISVGAIETPEEAEKVMAAGIDFVALGRELIREPYWVQKVMAGREDTIRYTIAPDEFDELHLNPALLAFTNEIHSDLKIIGQNEAALTDEMRKAIGSSGYVLG